MPRVARSRSADGVTTAALFPPSSSRARPNRSATRGPTERPMRVEPVALRSATPGWSTRADPTSAPPARTWLTSAGAPCSARARSRSAALAAAVNGACSDGFQITGSPQTRATAAFQDQTAAGKLKALMTPTTPRGCQVSIRRCPGRSDGIVRPYSCRDRPTAKSQMSIISCTSPRASEVILPTSRLIRVARSRLCSVNSSPSRLTTAPRPGAGTVRHDLNACCARSTAESTAAASTHSRECRCSPLMGDVVAVEAARVPSTTPQRPAVVRARAWSSSALGMVAGVVAMSVSLVGAGLRLLDDVQLGAHPGIGEATDVEAADVDDGPAAEVEVAHDLPDGGAHQEAVPGEAGGIEEPVDGPGFADEGVVVGRHLVQAGPAARDADLREAGGAALHDLAEPEQP